MDEMEAIKAADAAKAVLEEAGWEVQEIVLHCAVTHPEDKQFAYTVNSYRDPDKVESSVRARLFDSLVATAEKYADPERILAREQAERDGWTQDEHGNWHR